MRRIKRRIPLSFLSINQYLAQINVFSTKPESVSPDGGGGGDDDDRLVIAEDEPADEKKPAVKTERKPRKKQNRFNGLSEEEVAKRILPDLLTEGLQILIVSFLKPHLSMRVLLCPLWSQPCE